MKFLLAATVALSAATTGYHLTGKFTIGGTPGWDYINIDPGTRRLFVSHVTQMEVLDADSGKLLGRITNTPGVHGIALAPELGKGFAGNGQMNTVSVINLKTLAHIKELPAGKKPDAIVYDPGTNKVIVANNEGASVTLIDAVASKVTAEIPLGGVPEFIATDLKGTAWVNLEDKDAVAILDLNAQKLTGAAPLPGCKAPSAMAIDRTKGKLFIGCRNNTLVIFDIASRQVTGKLPIGEHVDATAFDPGSGFVFASTGDGFITIVKETTRGQYGVFDNVKTQRTAKTMAFDPKTRKIFLPAVEGAPETATGPPKASGSGAYQAGEFVVLVVAR